MARTESRHHARPTRGRSLRRSGWLAVVAGAMVFGVLAPGAVAAYAQDKALDDYATWDDVVAAQGDIDKQNALITEIKGQIEDLKVQVTDAEAKSEEASNNYSSAKERATRQSEQVYTLDLQVEDARKRADEAEGEAGAYAAAMANSVPSDPTVQLLAQPESADEFLRGMSTLSKLGTHNSEVYEQAISARNSADQLATQAQDALDELNRLEDEAQANYEAAVQAQQDLQKKRDQKINKGSELEAMLIPLTERRNVVEADYKEGERKREEERRRIEEERRRAAEAAAAEAARRAAEEAAAAAAASSYSPPPAAAPSAPAPSGGGGGDSGAPAPGGYSYPMSSAGWITDYFGMRLHPVYGYWKMHTGIDIVVPGGTCWAPIYAVTDATVTMASYVDGWGNLLVYEDADGTVFMNAHISDGGFAVWPGQHVSAGEVVAYAGTTGPSTGCHLHFQIEVGGTPIDPLDWLGARGMYY